MKRYLYIVMLASICFACHKDTEEVEMPKAPAILLLSSHDFEMPKEGGIFSVEVNAIGEYTVEIPLICRSWLHEESREERTFPEATHRFSIAANDAFRPREGYVIFKNGRMRDTALIHQAESGVLLLSEHRLEVTDAGGTFAMEINATGECTVEVPAAFQTWIGKAPESKATFNNTYHFTVEKNQGYLEREGYLVVNNGTLNDTLRIRQAALPLLLVNMHKIEMTEEGGCFSVKVEGNTDFEISIPASCASWLTESTGEATTHTHRFQVSKNEDFQQRTGYIVWNYENLTDTIYVNQAPRRGGFIWGENFTEKIVITDRIAVDLEMIYVEGGSFTMGASEEEDPYNVAPQHQVVLSDYYISKYEVTLTLWKTVMEEDWESSLLQYHNAPKLTAFEEAQSFVEKLRQRTGKKYTLPTEAQWEYAARGGNKSKGYKYSGSDDIDEVSSQNHRYTWGGNLRIVGQKAANELSIYDMSGNAGEWCQDWYSPTYYKFSPLENPQGPAEPYPEKYSSEGYYPHVSRFGIPVWDRIVPHYSDPNGIRIVLLP